jgi:hypothetical protein
VSDHPQDPAQVSDETLRSFEADLPEPEPEEETPGRAPQRWQGPFILAGMAALIALGLATALTWVF